jgi:NAD(P)-dependent dehydrogenase (short-subunit alcohol dehydrogenase family)
MSTIVITGSSSGIGAEAARALAKQGHELAIVGRDAARTKAVATEVGGRAYLADYDRLDDVRALAGELLTDFPRIDVLANNAGGLVSERGITADGHERVFQHNHLAPFLLTNLLLPALEESEGRVISTASNANRWGRVRLDDLEWEKRAWMGGWRAYGTSKIETILFIRELAQRTGLQAYSFHPGYVSTGFGRGSGLIRFSERLKPGGFGISAAQGAAPLVFLASAAVIPAPIGTFFDGLKPDGGTTKQAKDATLAAELWELSSDLVGLPGPGRHAG